MKLRMLTVRPSASSDPRSAFTIVEMVVSMTIIAIGVMGLMATYAHTSRTSITAEETTVAANAARAKMDEIGGMTFSRVVDSYENQTVPFSVPGLLPDPAGSVTATRVGAAPTVLQITVTIAWEGIAGPRSTTYSTRLTSR